MVRGLVLTIVVCVGCAATAAASSTVIETGSVGPNLGGNPYGAQTSQLPRCRRGATAVAGGFETEFRIGDPAPPAIYPTTFRRERNTWHLGVSNIGTGGGEVTTYAYCEKVANVPVSIAYLAVRAVTPTIGNAATCTAGKVALAGGYVVDNPGELAFESIRTSRRAWTTTVTNLTGVESGLTAWAVCGKPKQTGLRPRQVSSVQPFAASGSGATATARASCPAGKTALSGGYAAPSYAQGVIVHRSLRIGGRSWEVSASSQVPLSGNLTAYAYCV